MFRLMQKLKRIKERVKGWNKYTFGNIFNTKRDLIQKPKEMKDQMEARNCDEEIYIIERELRAQWHKISKKEEIY